MAASMKTLSFVINAALSPKFKVTTSAASFALGSLKTKAAEFKSTSDALKNALDRGIISIDTYSRNAAALEKQAARVTTAQTKLGNALKGFSASNRAFDAVVGNMASFVYQTRAIAAPLVSSVNVAAEFEAGMSKVGAITGASAEEMKKLSAQAEFLGATTRFTARQSADAMSFLGMAGWKTNEIIAGMPGLLSLAAAGGTDLAKTADIVSDNLTAFGLAAEKSGHLADVYATVITNTNTNVEMLGETMKYAAPVAQAFGASMEEAAALAGIMAGAGIKASNAGTALRAGFSRLAGPPKAAAKAMDELGMSLSDVSREQAEAAAALKELGIETGNTQGAAKMSIIVNSLREKFKGLSKEEQTATAKAIFGQTAFAGWLAVINSEEGAFDKLLDSLYKCDGAAEKVAKQMDANTKGAYIRLQSAIEGVQLAIGQAFLPALAKIGENAATAASGIAVFAKEHQDLILYAGGAAAAVVGLIAATKLYAVVSASIQTAIAAWKLAQATYIGLKTACDLTTASSLRLSAASKISAASNAAAAAGAKLAAGAQWLFNASLWGCPILAIGAAVVAIGYIIYKNWDEISALAGRMWDAGKAAIIAFCDVVKEVFDKITKWWGNLTAFLGAPVSTHVNNYTHNVENSAAKGTYEFDDIDSNASGGIYNKGAFLTTFAENSGESAIPHEPTARNIGLLARTNEIMGNPLGVGNLPEMSQMTAQMPPVSPLASDFPLKANAFNESNQRSIMPALPKPIPQATAVQPFFEQPQRDKPRAKNETKHNNFSAGLMKLLQPQSTSALPILPLFEQPQKDKPRAEAEAKHNNFSAGLMKLVQPQSTSVLPILPQIIERTYNADAVGKLTTNYTPQQTGRGLLAEALAKFDAEKNAPNNDNSSVINATFSPVINISGSASREEVKAGIEDAYPQFERFMTRWQHQSRRLSYA